MTVITRFAPSPTGFLHIGGARTALFSWLFARAHNGKFLLRIEDTDRERSTQEAIDAIIDGLDWLGLSPDEAPTFQSSRAERHLEVANKLVELGAAYHCPVSGDELQARRNAAAALKQEKDLVAGLDETTQQAIDKARDQLLQPFRSKWRNEGVELPKNTATAIRLRVPDIGSIDLDDEVQGLLSVPVSELDDLILVRSDGTPTYMLAVVVDDHDMGVTHVIRGDDHLRNTFRQIPIYEAMGWNQPTYAHIPLIHGSDGKKLSKRHGALGVQAYRDMGYLPQGLKNYLLRLGWSHGDDELISETQAIEWFGMEGLGKAPARLDLDKLDAVNTHYMGIESNEALSKAFFSRPNAQSLSDSTKNRIEHAMFSLKTRAPNLEKMEDAARYLHDLRPIQLTGKTKKILSDTAKEHLREFTQRLVDLPNWTEPDLKAELERYCTEKDVGIGKVGPALRAVLTGGAPAPDITLVLALLGRDECLARIHDQTG